MVASVNAVDTKMHSRSVSGHQHATSSPIRKSPCLRVVRNSRHPSMLVIGEGDEIHAAQAARHGQSAGDE